MSTKAPGVALVTDASGGIGGAVARRLASDGSKVVAHHAGSPTRAEKVVSEIAAKGGRAITIQADVADLADVRALFEEARMTLGGIITVNGLARSPVATPLFLDGKTDGAGRAVRQAFAARAPRPQDIANVVSLLVRPDGSWVNGQVLRAEGGFA
jgi:NAD(P)-dependent dehydrogenase (short-subunit alcohol dehydrogenase family)